MSDPETELEEEIVVDPAYCHAIWVCPTCSSSGRHGVASGLIFIAICGKLTRFGSAGTKCPECVSLMQAQQNRTCHYCARSA